MRAAVVLALLGAGAIAPAAQAAPARPALTCTGFMANFTRAAEGHTITFERPINITRGFGGDDGTLDVRVLSTGRDEVEGTLKCRGDAFSRFDLRIEMPAGDKVIAAFKDYEEATLAAAFGWDKPKVQTIVGAMSSDAAEYMRASIQRGDTYVSGKVEYHQADTLDLGVIWTGADRTLVVTTQDAS